MSAHLATDLIRRLSEDLGIDDMPQDDPSLGLLIDGRSVTLDYLADAEAFLIHGPVPSGIRLQDPGVLMKVCRVAHATAMTGGGSLTIDTEAGRVVYSERVPIEDLTVETLGAWAGQVSTAIGLLADMLQAGEEESAPPLEDYGIRV